MEPNRSQVCLAYKSIYYVCFFFKAEIVLNLISAIVED